METTENFEGKSPVVRYWAIAGGLVCVIASYLIIPDISWEFFQHLFLGQLIFTSTDIPSAAALTPMSAPAFRLGSSWCFDLFLAVVNLKLGPVGVIIVKQLLLIGIITSWVLVFARLAEDNVFGLFLGAILAFCVLLFNQTTAATVALGLFPWLMLLSQDFLKTPSIRSGAKVFLLTVFYINIHPSVVGVILAALLLARIESKQIPTAICFIILSTFALFLRPYPFTQCLQFQQQFKALVGDMLFGIEPIYRSNHELGVLLVLLSVVVYFLAKARAKIRIDTLFAAVCFLTLGISCKKYFGFAAVSLCIVIAMLKPGLDDSLGSRFNQAKTKILSFTNKIPLSAGVFFLFALTVFFVSRTISIPRSPLLWPVKESEILLKDSNLLPVVHTPEVGSFLAYKSADENHALPQDIIINDFLKYTDYRLYLSARGLCDLKPGWRDVFSRINPSSVICPINSPMFYLLSSNPTWIRLSSEGQNVVAKARNRQPRYALFAQKK